MVVYIQKYLDGWSTSFSGWSSIFSPVFVDKMFSFGLPSMKRPVFMDETSVFGLASFHDLG